MDFTIGLEAPFSLDYTLESGQVFRWERKGVWWEGIVPAGVLKVRQEGDSLKCSSESEGPRSEFVRDYFRLEYDIEGALGSIAKDPVISRAVEKFYGMRLIRQERWECLASFVLATNSNIPRIKKMISAVCAKYGEGLDGDADRYTFPRPDSLAKAPVGDLRRCGLGYRAPFLRKVASAVASGKIDLDRLSEMPYGEAKKLLLRELQGEKILLGVGPKVADCVLLFSCGMDEAFPIDVWIAGELSKSYPNLFPATLKKRLTSGRKVKLSLADYDRVSGAARSYFGPFAGYAQQYLYMAARSSESG